MQYWYEWRVCGLCVVSVSSLLVYHPVWSQVSVTAVSPSASLVTTAVRPSGGEGSKSGLLLRFRDSRSARKVQSLGVGLPAQHIS